MPRRIPLPAIVQTLWSLFGMDSFLQFCLKRFADEKMLTFRIVGIGELVSVRDPQLIREVFTGDSDVFRGGEANAQVGGTTVAASIAGIQRSPKVYPDPLRFWPERFLEQPAPYTLIPFGGGERRCIGASFAIMEIKTVLRTVLQRVDLHVPNVRDERPSRTRSVGIVPGHGTRAIATARLRPGRVSRGSRESRSPVTTG